MTDLSDDDLVEFDPEFDIRRLTPGRALLLGILILSFLPWAWRFSPWADRTPDGLFDQAAYGPIAEEICTATMAELDALPNALKAQDNVERAEQIRAGTTLLVAMVDELEAATAGSERDVRIIGEWVGDWRAYLEDRVDYADRMAVDPEAQLYIAAVGQERLERRITRLADTNEMPACGTPSDVG